MQHTRKKTFQYTQEGIWTRFISGFEMSTRALHVVPEDYVLYTGTTTAFTTMAIHPTTKITLEEMSSAWRKQLEEYTDFDFTFETDRLVALSGLRSEGRYVAGFGRAHFSRIFNGNVLLVSSPDLRRSMLQYGHGLRLVAVAPGTRQSISESQQLCCRVC